jgi:hypothetical protein
LAVAFSVLPPGCCSTALAQGHGVVGAVEALALDDAEPPQPASTTTEARTRERAVIADLQEMPALQRAAATPEVLRIKDLCRHL